MCVTKDLKELPATSGSDVRFLLESVRKRGSGTYGFKPPTSSSAHHGYHLFGRFDTLPGSSTSPMPKIIFRGAGFRLPHMPAVLRMAML